MVPHTVSERRNVVTNVVRRFRSGSLILWGSGLSVANWLEYIRHSAIYALTHGNRPPSPLTTENVDTCRVFSVQIRIVPTFWTAGTRQVYKILVVEGDGYQLPCWFWVINWHFSPKLYMSSHFLWFYLIPYVLEKVRYESGLQELDRLVVGG